MIDGTIGKIKINSTSKIRKMIAIKKNRIEKGKRDMVLGENPHSKGLNFSRSEYDLNPNPLPMENNKKDNTKTEIIVKIINLN